MYIVDHVDQADKLVPYLKKMGERHVKYGTEPEHYDWVGASLLKTFAFFFGEEWTDELQSEWTDAYNFIAETMISGAEDYLPGSEELREKAHHVCQNILLETLSAGLDQEFEAFARARVRKLLFKILEEESEKILKKSA